MKHRRDFLKAAGALSLLSSLYGCQSVARKTSVDLLKADYPLTPVPFYEVELQDAFWKPRLETQAKTLVPFALEKTQPAVDNLRKTGAWLRGDKTSLPFPHRYVASDLYKVMEGAAYLLKERPDPALERRMDEIIDIIESAQQADGYMYEAHITGVSKDAKQWGPGGMGDKPYSYELHSHELYNMGHMYEGAIAYYQATGKDRWLKVAEKNAQHINKVFFIGDPNYNGGKPVNQAPGHQEIELALVKLYRVTGNRLYLQMAKRFLDIRGVTYVPSGEGPVMQPSYAQQHKPVAQQEEVEGHAVRAVYMYSGMADVDALTGSKDYDHALNSIWHNIVDTRMHITGGLGAIHGSEGFGKNYELPNKECYNETCAAVGNVLFNFRMFLLTGDAKFMDVAEVALFNNALVGTNLEGNRFFYVNPLEADGTTPFNKGKPGRSPWFNTACCPSNLARLIPQVPGMMYVHKDDDIYVTLYGSNSTAIDLPAGKVALTQRANYPFDGRIAITVHPDKRQSFRVNLRIPTWANSNQFLPGELYDYVGEPQIAWELRVNGKLMKPKLQGGFAIVEREWQKGDEITLHLPMPVRFNTALEKVEADRGRVAVTRGPLVYCAEAADNGEPVQQFQFTRLPAPSSIKVGTFGAGMLANIVKIEMQSTKILAGRQEDGTLVLIPYYAWDNRGDGSMIVWMRAEDASEPRLTRKS